MLSAAPTLTALASARNGAFTRMEQEPAGGPKRRARKRAPLTGQECYTGFQRWLLPALDRAELSIADLGRMIGKDYNYAWKLARGNPNEDPNVQRRPGYEVALAIGEKLGDVQGALAAAEYPLPEDQQSPAPPLITAGMEIVLDLREGPRRGTLTDKTIRAIAELLESVDAEPVPDESKQ